MQLLSQKQIKSTKRLLDNGAVLAVPTETVYGLAVKFDHADAVAKLLSIKSRKTHDDNKVLTLMLADVAEIGQYAQLNAIATKIATQHFPGELTLVLPKNPNFQNHYFDHFETIGIRIPNHTFMLKLLKLTGPLLVTSANPRGETPCHNSTEVQRQLPAVDGVIIGQSGGSLPSTVISIIDTEPKILRQGGLII